MMYFIQFTFESFFLFGYLNDILMAIFLQLYISCYSELFCVNQKPYYPVYTRFVITVKNSVCVFGEGKCLIKFMLITGSLLLDEILY